jgi:hypothetical protein
MAIGVTTGFEGDDAFEALRRFPQRLAKELHGALLRYLRGFAAVNGPWQRKFMRGRPGLKRQSGDLARSFEVADLTSDPSNVATVGARVFTRSRYAWIHEAGGVIEAKTDRTITVKRAALRATLPDGRALTVGERTYTYTRRMLVWKDRRGRWYSKRRVTIPARMHFRASFEEDAPTRAVILPNAVARSLGNPPPFPTQVGGKGGG